MKKCIGTNQLPHEKIKYNSEWCPMCALKIIIKNQRDELHRLKFGGKKKKLDKLFETSFGCENMFQLHAKED